MDFLEGALLGPLWSDTDYADRPHQLLATAYILLVYALLAYLLILPQKPFFVLSVAPFFWFGFLLLFMILSTFFSRKYYEQGLFGRLGILGFQVLKYSLATGFLLSLFRPLYQLQLGDLKELGLQFLNENVGDFINQVSIRFRIGGLLVVGFLLALIGFFLLIFLLALLVCLPVYYLKLVRLLQTSIDKLLMRGKTIY